MSQENVEVVRRIFEYWEAGDFGGALALFDNDLVTRRLAPMRTQVPGTAIKDCETWRLPGLKTSVRTP